eukprot:6246517-Alexandrium_andersonii.AAC.1
MGKATKSSSPALVGANGEWIVESSAKANLFADHFSAKWQLRDSELNEFSNVPQPLQQRDGFLVLRTRLAARTLAALREASATGPDELPA